MFNLFGSNAAPAEPAVVAPTPIDTSTAPVVTPVADPPAPVEPVVGLDKWKGLVDNESSEGKPPVEPAPIFDPVAILKDPAALEQITSSLDFSKSISEETQQKLADKAPDGIISLVNDIAKASYQQALQHSTALSQQHVTDVLARQEDQTSSNIQSHIKDYELEQQLPEVKNPIVRLGTQQFISELRKQQPNISSQDVASEVRSYLTELSKNVNPPAPTPAEQQAADNVDWMAEMGFK